MAKPKSKVEEKEIKKESEIRKAMREEYHRLYDKIKTYPWPTTWEEITCNTLVASSYVKPEK